MPLENAPPLLKGGEPEEQEGGRGGARGAAAGGETAAAGARRLALGRGLGLGLLPGVENGLARVNEPPLLVLYENIPGMQELVFTLHLELDLHAIGGQHLKGLRGQQLLLLFAEG